MTSHLGFTKNHLGFTALCLFRGVWSDRPPMDTAEITAWLREHGYKNLRESSVEKLLHRAMDEDRRSRATQE